MFTRQQGSTNYPIPIHLILSSDHRSPATGLGSAVTVLLDQNSSGWIPASGAITEIGFGDYSLAGNINDRGVLGTLSIMASGSGTDIARLDYLIVNYDPVTDIENIINRLGPITGSNSNTLLGYIQAICSTDNPIPTDIGGNFDPTTDSLEATSNNVLSNLLYSEALDLRITDGRATEIDNLDATVSSRAAPGAQMTLTSGEEISVANAILNLSDSIEAGESLAEVLRLLRAALTGESVENNGTVIFKRKDGTRTALTVVHDSIGDRSASTVGDLSP